VPTAIRSRGFVRVREKNGSRRREKRSCSAFKLPDRTVQFLGDFTSPEPGHFAITGGTRAYFGATGEVTFVDKPAPARDEVTFRFVTPR
jgi:hypothetical protein